MSHRNGTPSMSSALPSAVFSAVAIQRSVVGRSPRRAAVTASPHAARAMRRWVVVQVAEVGDALEAELGGVEAVGVAQHEPLGDEAVGALGVGEIGGAQQLRRLGERLVVAPERHEHAEDQREPARAGAGVLRARLPRPRRDAEALRRPLEVLAGVGVHRALAEHLVGTGERLALALAELVQRVVDDALGDRDVALASGGRGPTRPPRGGGPAAAPSTARSTARSMSAAASSRRPIWRLAPARSSSSSGSRSTVEPRRASRLSIDRGSIVSATDSVSPRIMLVARSWPPASSTSVIASRARPRCSMSSASVPATAGSTGVPRSAAAAASSRVAVDLSPERHAAGDRIADEPVARRAGRASPCRCRVRGRAGRRPSAVAGRAGAAPPRSPRARGARRWPRRPTSGRAALRRAPWR